MKRFTLTLLALLLVSCEPESPAALDSSPTGFEAVREIMNSPVDETTIARLNTALGSPADAPMVHVRKNPFAGKDVIVTDANTGESFRTTIVSGSGRGQEVVCSFTNGGSINDYNDFVACRDEHDDCSTRMYTDVIHDPNGTTTVIVTELEVVCEASLNS